MPEGEANRSIHGFTYRITVMPCRISVRIEPARSGTGTGIAIWAPPSGSLHEE